MSYEYEDQVAAVIRLLPSRLASSHFSLEESEYSAFTSAKPGYGWEAARRARAERIVNVVTGSCPQCRMIGYHKMDCSNQ